VASAKFSFPLTGKITQQLEWPTLPEDTKAWTPEDDDLQVTRIYLQPDNSELAGLALELDCLGMSGIQVIRKKKREGKDSVKSGKVETNVLCTIKLADAEGCGKIERYMASTMLSTMTIWYEPRAVQEDLPGTLADGENLPFASDDAEVMAVGQLIGEVLKKKRNIQ